VGETVKNVVPCSLSYEQLIAKLREHNPKGSKAVETALEQIYTDADARRQALIDHLRGEKALPTDPVQEHRTIYAGALGEMTFVICKSCGSTYGRPHREIDTLNEICPYGGTSQ
jgi:hypothetical protein